MSDFIEDGKTYVTHPITSIKLPTGAAIAIGDEYSFHPEDKAAARGRTFILSDIKLEEGRILLYGQDLPDQRHHLLGDFPAHVTSMFTDPGVKLTI